MAGAGLGPAWDCRFANDIDRVKAEVYRANWGDDHLHLGDVHALSPDELPVAAHGGAVDLAWASSPCQDFSLAGLRAGLEGRRSSAFWGFWRLIEALGERAPDTIVIENVPGLLTARSGADFEALCAALARQGYRFGALEIDAALFVPQSRPRLFVIATRRAPPSSLLAPAVAVEAHGRRLHDAWARLPAALRSKGLAWRPISAPPRNVAVADVLQGEGEVAWRTADATARLLHLLGPLHRERLRQVQAEGRPRIGLAYRRTRIEDRRRVQRAEVRFDGLAGCLRTPGGGSSKQFVLAVHGETIRSRPLTAREGARLMGLPDDYRLPGSETAALHVVGDGVAVPVVRALAEQILEPLIGSDAVAAAE